MLLITSGRLALALLLTGSGLLLGMRSRLILLALILLIRGSWLGVLRLGRLMGRLGLA